MHTLAVKRVPFYPGSLEGNKLSMVNTDSVVVLSSVFEFRHFFNFQNFWFVFHLRVFLLSLSLSLLFWIFTICNVCVVLYQNIAIVLNRVTLFGTSNTRKFRYLITGNSHNTVNNSINLIAEVRVWEILIHKWWIFWCSFWLGVAVRYNIL